MTLLTPSEAHAFQSFLSSVDTSGFSADWDVGLDVSHEHIPPTQSREALTKATRDLMSLDADKWRYPFKPQFSLTQNSAAPGHRHPQTQDPFSLSFLTPPRRPSETKLDAGNDLNLPSSRLQPSSVGRQLPPLQSSAHARTSVYDPRSSSSSRQSPIGPSGSSSSTQSSTPGPPSIKRSPPLETDAGNKRYRLSDADASTPQSSSSSADTKPSQHNRTALLSPSQKKANHIQSEQKRRANIRRGYDALCEIVPALRDACRAEEERISVHGMSKGRRRGRSKATDDDGKKSDGRAGPRSEGIVLSKTIDYMNELLLEREVLMQRLYVVRNALPAGHPLLQCHPDSPPSLWERKWNGGQCKEGEDDDEDDEEE